MQFSYSDFLASIVHQVYHPVLYSFYDAIVVPYFVSSHNAIQICLPGRSASSYEVFRAR